MSQRGKSVTGKSNQADLYADDDGSVEYAFRGCVAWGSLAITRALFRDKRRAGDPLYDRLLAVQAELAQLREEWPNVATG